MLFVSPLLPLELSQLNLPLPLVKYLSAMGVSRLDDVRDVSFGCIAGAEGITPEALVELAKQLNHDLVADADTATPDTATPVDVLDLSARPRNSLRRAGIHSVEELQARSEMRLLAIPNLGVTSLEEIKEKLSDYLLREGRGRGENALPISPLQTPVRPKEMKPKQITRIRELLDFLGETFKEREFPVLVRRFDETLDAIGKDLKVTRERIRQLENSGKSRLREASERHLPMVFDSILDLTNGRVSSFSTIVDSLPQDDLDGKEEALLIALLRALDIDHPRAFGVNYLDWWTSDRWLLEQCLRAKIDECVPCGTDGFAESLTDAPFPETFPVMAAINANQSPILTHPITGDLVRKDARHRDACYLLLSRNREALTVQQLAETLEMKPHAIGESLRRDSRFVRERPSGLCYLKEWDLSGVQRQFSSTHEAAIHILALNGAMTQQDLYRQVAQVYPVSQAAVQNVLSHRAIGRTDAGLIDLVRHGATHEPDKKPSQPDSVRVNEGKGTISFDVNVTSELLRGSGLSLSRFVTWWLGLRSAPSEQTFRCGESEIRVSRAIHASTISTLREHALRLGANPGDLLLVALDPGRGTADIALKSEHPYPEERGMS